MENAPTNVVERFLRNETQESCKYISGTILAASFANFSYFVNCFSASDFIAILEDLMAGIDQTLLSRNIEKLAMNGVMILFNSDPNSHSLLQVRNISTCAVMLLNFIERFTVKRPLPYSLQMKVGVATGTVLAGVLGKKLPKYILVGEAVDEAFILLFEAQPGTIRLAKRAYEMLKQCDGYFETCVLKGCQKVCMIVS